MLLSTVDAKDRSRGGTSEVPGIKGNELLGLPYIVQMAITKERRIRI